jgi:putative Mn2+ efflux pump MntP
MIAFIKMLLIATALGLDVFAVCVGVGMRASSPAAKIRIGAAFAAAEVGMSLIGVGIGAGIGRFLGDAAGYVGCVALAGLGAFMLRESGEVGASRLDLSHGWGLFIGSLSISLDSLGIGLTLLYVGVPLSAALATIAAVSVASTYGGLAFGRMLGLRAEASAAKWAGIVLLLTGIGIAAFKYFRVEG